MSWVIRCLDKKRADRRWLWSDGGIPGWVLNTTYCTSYPKMEDAIEVGVRVMAMLESSGWSWVTDMSVVTLAEADAETPRFSK